MTDTERGQFEAQLGAQHDMSRELVDELLDRIATREEELEDREQKLITLRRRVDVLEGRVPDTEGPYTVIHSYPDMPESIIVRKPGKEDPS